MNSAKSKVDLVNFACMVLIIIGMSCMGSVMLLRVMLKMYVAYRAGL